MGDKWFCEGFCFIRAGEVLSYALWDSPKASRRVSRCFHESMLSWGFAGHTTSWKDVTIFYARRCVQGKG